MWGCGVEEGFWWRWLDEMALIEIAGLYDFGGGALVEEADREGFDWAGRPIYFGGKGFD